MPYIVTINALIEGEATASDAQHLAGRLQSALDNIRETHGYSIVEYHVYVEDEVMGIRVAADESTAARNVP